MYDILFENVFSEKELPLTEEQKADAT